MTTPTVRFLWLIPVTESEIQYKKRFGMEALEDQFEKTQFNFLDSLRESVV